MKIRNGFVSNSSSSSFIVKNLSCKKMNLEDFAKETSYMVEDFNNYYNWNDYDVESFMKCVSEYDYVWGPDESIEVVFGDEHGNIMGQIYDYMLRYGGKSENFIWWFNEARR